MKIKIILIVSLYLLLRVSTLPSLLEFQDKSVITAKQLNCLKLGGYLDETFIQVLNLFGNFQTSVEFDELEKSQSDHPHLLLITIDNVLATQSASRWAKYLSSRKYKSLWVDTRETTGYKLNCQKTWSFVSTLSSLLNKQIGIYINGNEYKWPDNYYDLNSCQKLGIFPLFYESKDSFKPFANWSFYSLRIGKTVENVCGLQEIKEVLNE